MTTQSSELRKTGHPTTWLRSAACVAFCLWCQNAFPQQVPKYAIGVEVVGGNDSSCPVFIGRVFNDSPAGNAGLRIGDRLVSVDGHSVKDVQDASRRLGASDPSLAIIEVRRNKRTHKVSVQREGRTILLQRDGWKELNGILVAADATDGDNRYQLAMARTLESSSEASEVAFPDGHYPRNKELYYPGFEVFLWDPGDT